MSWVIYNFSHMLICLLWFCLGLPKGEIVRTYMFHILGSYVSILDTFIPVHGSCVHFWHTLYLSSLYVDVCFFHLALHVLFLFSLYAHASYFMYEIYYFCFTQRCLNEFRLKCFRNTGCQSLPAVNSLLAKFFKSLC